MARTRKITDEQILKAAQAVFLEKGFGASTVEIAERAGISEGSIFKRFTTKENLFFAAMGLSNQPWFSFLETTVGQGDLKENLKIIGRKVVEFYQENLPKMMMVMSKGMSLPPPMARSNLSPPIRNLKALTQFFEQEAALGRMQASDPKIVAQIFIGSLMNYVLLRQAPTSLPNTPEYVDSMVEIFWKSIKPEN